MIEWPVRLDAFSAGTEAAGKDRYCLASPTAHGNVQNLVLRV